MICRDVIVADADVADAGDLDEPHATHSALAATRAPREKMGVQRV